MRDLDEPQRPSDQREKHHGRDDARGGIGSTVTIETEGSDEAEAMKAILALIADKFGEGQ